MWIKPTLVRFLILLGIIYALANCTQKNSSNSITITYPFNHAVFPADITAPTFRWKDETADVKKWRVSVKNESVEVLQTETDQMLWLPTKQEWEELVKNNSAKSLQVNIAGVKKKDVSQGAIEFSISEDKVEAPIFFRAVPLPFKFARENLKRVRWHLGSVSEEAKPHSMLDNIPVCANCHSFTPGGKTLAMDVDARDDKGAYVITEFGSKTTIDEDSIIHWSDFQDGKFTYGLLSQVSPDGRYVVSTLKDCEIFTDRKELEYSQLFFPFKGILVVYDRKEKRYFELEGANDTTMVQSNPCWTPDGKYIYFARAEAKHFEESGIHHGSVPKSVNANRYKKFEKSYMDRDSLMKFNIYRVPFNKGKGGKAEAIKGAANNSKSNYFPKISPDGKWLVFCQAESFMLLQKDSKLQILPADGGEPRQMNCNTGNMNSWHSWSPNGKWLVYSTKAMSPFTQLFITHIDGEGNDSPPVFLENFAFENYAANIPEFVNIKYDRNLKIEPTFLSENDFLIRNGEISMKNGDMKTAFSYFDKAVRSFPNDAEAFHQRGRIFYEQKQLTKAITDFNKAIGLEQRAPFFVSRGIAYLKLKKNKEAENDLTRAIELDGENHTPYTYLGINFFQKDDYEKAISYLEKSTKLFDGDAYSQYYLGLASFSANKVKEANSALSKAIKLRPDKRIVPLIYELRGKTWFKMSDFTRAIEDANYVIKLNPRDPALYLLKGKSELKMGMKAEARTSLLKAKQLGARSADVYLRQL